MEENKTTQKLEETSEETGLALIEQDKSTLKILQEDDLKNLKAVLEKAKVFKKKYTMKKLEVTDITNKDQREKLRLALQEMRTTRTGLKEEKTDKTKPYRDTVAYINSNYDAVITAIETIEEPLIAYNKQVKADLEAKEKEEENRIKKMVDDRRDILIKEGAVFNDGYFEAGSLALQIPLITLGEIDLKTLTDPLWENVLVQVKEKVAATAAAQKKIDDAAAQKKIDDDAETNRIKDENKQRALQVIELRGELLAAIGMEAMENPAGFKYGSLSITNEFIGIAAKAEWDVEYNKLKTSIAEAKKEEEQKRLLANRQKELLDLKLVWNAGTQEYALNKKIAVSLDTLKTATADEWSDKVSEVKSLIKLAEELAKLLEDRHNEIIGLGLSEVVRFEKYQYKNSVVDLTENIGVLDHAYWLDIINIIKQRIISVDNAIALQATRLSEISPFLLPLHTVKVDELYTLDQATYNELLEENKKAHQAKVEKDLNDAAEDKAKKDSEKLAKSTDEVKWKHFIDSLPVPSEMGSEDYKKLVYKANEFIKQIKALTIS